MSTNTDAKIVEEKVYVNTVVFAEHASHVAAAPSAITTNTNILACSATLNAPLVRTAGSSTSASNAMVKASAIMVNAEQIVQSVRVPASVSTEYIVMVARNVEDAACASTAVRDMPAKSAREDFIAFTKKSRVTVSSVMGVRYARTV